MKELYVISLMILLSISGSSVIFAENSVKNGDAEAGIDNWSGVKSADQEAKQGAKSFQMVNAICSSKELIPVDVKKNYFISGWFKNTGSVPAKLLLGAIPFDKDQVQILPEEINTVPQTETILAAECNAEDSVIKVKDASKWKIGKSSLIAFGVSNDYVDLPNRNLSMAGIAKIEKKTDYWEIHLEKLCGKNFPAGTNVREHSAGNTCIFPVIETIKPSSEWTQFSKRINYMVGKGNASYTENWWCGTAFIKIIIICNESKLLFDDIKFQLFTY